MALYIPHSIFHLARLLYCQAGNFWTVLCRRTIFVTGEYRNIALTETINSCKFIGNNDPVTYPFPFLPSSFFHNLSLIPSRYRWRWLFMYLVTLSDTHTHTYKHGRTPLEEGSVSRKGLYLTTHNTHKRQPCTWQDSNPQSQQVRGWRLKPYIARPLGSTCHVPTTKKNPSPMMMMMMMMNTLYIPYLKLQTKKYWLE